MMAAVSMVPQSRPAQSIPSRRKTGIGSPPGMSPMTSVSERLQKSETTVITTSATSVAGIFLVTSGKKRTISTVPTPSSSAVSEMPCTTASGMPSSRSIMVPEPFSPTNG